MKSHTSLQWLNARRINDAVIARFGLSWDDKKITIPVHDVNGKFLFNKYRFFEGENKYKYDTGGTVSLFGASEIKEEKTIVITEGEFDALALWSEGIPAVSGTGGCGTFRKEWAEFLSEKEVIICYDNDDPGMRGAINVLSFIPNAKVVFVPADAGVKDISDYIVRGGNVSGLLSTAKHFVDLETVEKDEMQKTALWQSTVFHEQWKKKFSPKKEVVKKSFTSNKETSKERAKEYPMTNLIEFRQNKSTCLWHKEKTASLCYYPKTNTAYCFGSCARSYDSIDAYMNIHQVSFLSAVEKLS